MAQDIPDWYLDALAQSHTPETRVVLLDDSRVPILEITGEDGFMFDGGFSATRSGNPSRIVDISIVNANGAWTPRTLSDEFAIGRYATVERGIDSPAGELRFQLMIGQITDPNVQVSADDNTMGLKLVDLWRVLQKTRFQQSAVKQRGMRVMEWIRQAAVMGGWPDQDDQFDMDDGGTSFTEDHPIELYGLIADDLQQTANDFALWLRVGWDGVLMLSPLPTVDNQGDAIRDYSPGETSTLMGITKQLTDAGFYNHTRVMGASLRSGTVVTAEWRDLNQFSPSYNPAPDVDPKYPRGGGPMGDRMMEQYSSAVILTTEAAETKAKQLGFDAATLQETHDLAAIADPSLEPGDVVQLGIEDADAVGDLLINEISMGLTVGTDDLFRIGGARQRQLVA